MAALALDVVVPGFVGRGEPCFRVGRGVPQTADGVAGLTVFRGVATGLEGFPRVRVGGFPPSRLGTRVAAPAGGRFRRGVAVPEKAQGHIIPLGPGWLLGVEASLVATPLKASHQGQSQR